MNDLLAILTIMVWPVIPLFWVPVHFSISFFRKLGLSTYILPFITWLPLAYLIYTNKASLLQLKLVIPGMVKIAGIVIFISGSLLHIWTARLLGLWGIIGVPEISRKTKNDIITQGPFSIVRHPTYTAHTLIFAGVFLITGAVTVGVITLLDFVIVNAVIIPLEERELSNRFGEDFISYKKNVPARVFPRIYNR
jgi:protein-S-isoprenylcysteine O-methyltransferase Ste14